MATGTIKVLRAWPYDEFAAGGWAVPPPPVDFLRRHDVQLAADVLQLLADSPETVTVYLHAAIQRDYAGTVAKADEDEFGHITYEYPRTRNVLRTLLENVINALEELVSHLPAKRWWKTKPGPREICKANVEQFRGMLKEWSAITSGGAANSAASPGPARQPEAKESVGRRWRHGNSCVVMATMLGGGR